MVTNNYISLQTYSTKSHSYSNAIAFLGKCETLDYRKTQVKHEEEILFDVAVNTKIKTTRVARTTLIYSTCAIITARILVHEMKIQIKNSEMIFRLT